VLLTGTRASTKNVNIALNQVLARHASENDRVLIYLSGHIDPDIRSITGSFVTRDFCKETQNFGLNFRSLRHLVEDSIAGYILIIIDGCHSGVVAQGNKTITSHWFHFSTGEMDSAISNKTFITAVSSGRYAWERKEKRNSDFTDAFLSIVEDPKHQHSDLTLGDLFDQLCKTAEENRHSPPVKSGVEIGRNIFIRAKKEDLHRPPLVRGMNHVPLWLEEAIATCRSVPKKKGDCAFVRDNNWPDGSIVTPGDIIVKSWRVRNSGKESWKGYFLKMVGAARGVGRIQAPTLIPIADVKPGNEIDVEVELRMPPYEASVYAEFKLVDSSGTYLFPERKGLYVSLDVKDFTL
jgi:Ig-like domain from next to BRCA1 gene/Caspase domain